MVACHEYRRKEIYFIVPVEKLKEDLEKTKTKIISLQKKQKTLESKITETENLQITGMVRAVQMTPEQLAALLNAYANGQIDLPEDPMAVAACTAENAYEQE